MRHDHPVQVKGWCPGAVRPMAARDGLVVRVRPQAGRLSRVQAEGIAALAQRWAHPVLELTNRANLQLRGVDPGDHARLLDALRDLGLVDADALHEARRNVQVQPLWTDGDITPSLAQALGDLLASDAAPALPAKFGFAVDTGREPCLRDAYADIRLERHADLAPRGFHPALEMAAGVMDAVQAGHQFGEQGFIGAAVAEILADRIDQGLTFVVQQIP